MALRFTTTRLSGLRAAGRTGDLQHELIAPFLERELGPRHGRFFADFELEGSDQRAWYAEAEVPPRRGADLPLEARAAVIAAADAIVADIRTLAERLAAGSAQQANLARILLAATTYPEEDLWCDGDQPIAVNWGFAREDRPGVLPRAVTGLAAAPPSRSVTGAEVVPATGFAWAVRLRPALALAPLLWLVFIAMVLSIDRLLLPACGIDARWLPFSGSGALDSCPAPAATNAAVEEGLRLQAQVRQAELQLAEARQACAVPGRRASLRYPRASARGDAVPGTREAAATEAQTF